MPTRFNRLFKFYALQKRPLPEIIPAPLVGGSDSEEQTVEHVRAYDILEQIESLENKLMTGKVSDRFLDHLASHKQQLRKRSYRQVMVQLTTERNRK